MSRPQFDQKLIPPRVALDTTVFLRALGFESDESGLCAEFLRELLNVRVEVQVPAPVIAEIVRGDVKRTPQAKPGIVVTAFDELAAVRCGELFPKAQLSGGDKVGAALKYDAMIVACAVRWKAKHLVSLDEKLRNKATGAGVLGKQPSDYLSNDLFNRVLKMKKSST